MRLASTGQGPRVKKIRRQSHNTTVSKSRWQGGGPSACAAAWKVKRQAGGDGCFQLIAGRSVLAKGTGLPVAAVLALFGVDNAGAQLAVRPGPLPACLVSVEICLWEGYQPFVAFLILLLFFLGLFYWLLSILVCLLVPILSPLPPATCHSIVEFDTPTQPHS